MRRRSQRTKGVGRAAFLIPVAALAAAGCTSAGPVATASESAPALTASTAAARTEGAAGLTVPVTTYVSVVQNYDVPERNGAPRRLQYTVTNPKTIAALGALIEGLQVSKSQEVHSCPEQMSAAFSLEFVDTKGGKPVVQADVTCFGVMMTVNGREEPIRAFPQPPGVWGLAEVIEALLAPYAHTG